VAKNQVVWCGWSSCIQVARDANNIVITIQGIYSLECMLFFKFSKLDSP